MLFLLIGKNKKTITISFSGPPPDLIHPHRREFGRPPASFFYMVHGASGFIPFSYSVAMLTLALQLAVDIAKDGGNQRGLVIFIHFFAFHKLHQVRFWGRETETDRRRQHHRVHFWTFSLICLFLIQSAQKITEETKIMGNHPIIFPHPFSSPLWKSHVHRYQIWHAKRWGMIHGQFCTCFFWKKNHKKKSPRRLLWSLFEILSSLFVCFFFIKSGGKYPRFRQRLNIPIIDFSEI